VPETVQYEQFDQSSPPAGDSQSDPDLSRLSDIPMELSVEIGRAHMTVGETLDLRVGSVVALERQAGEDAELLVNGTAVARGEVVVLDEQYGLRVTEILEGNQIACSPGSGGQLVEEPVADLRRASDPTATDPTESSDPDSPLRVRASDASDVV
jgi:flagellar motor switch protein FliN